MEIRINLNDFVKFKLTDHGKDIFYHRFDVTNDWIARRGGNPIEPRMPEVDSNGYSKMQLWDFMTLFGPYMQLGQKECVQPFEIVYDLEEKDEH